MNYCWRYSILLTFFFFYTTASTSRPRDFFQYETDQLTSTFPLLSRRYPPEPLRLKSATKQVIEWKTPITDAIHLHLHQQKSVLFHRNLSNYHNARGADTAAVYGAPMESKKGGKNTSVSTTCTSTADVHKRLDSIVCSKTYLKSLISASKKCNLFGYFDTDHIRSCGVDSNGTYCRKHERSFPDPDYLAWDVLQECSLQTQSGTCSTSCKSSLSNFAAKFGCCIHVSRVSWFVEDNPHILILSPALWSYCGLTRPQPCGNVPTLPSSSIAGSCTYGCYAYARSALICNQIGSQLIDTYNTCGRKGSAMELGQLCGLNYKGTACFELQFSDNTDYLLSVYTACFKYFSSGVCKDKCRSALKHFRAKYGCCVNVYNGTAFGESSQLLGSIVTQYGLWSKCKVATPGMCTLPTDTGNFSYNVEEFCDNISIGGGAHANVEQEIYFELISALLLWAVLVFHLL